MAATLRRTLIARFTLLNAAVLGALGILLIVSSYRSISQISRDSLRRSTETVFGMIESVAENSVRSYLRASAERAMDLVRDAYGHYRSGEMGEKEAQKLATDELSKLRIGDTGYAYVLDTDGVLVSHPSPSLSGGPAPEYGPLADQLGMREGYMEYVFKAPEETSQEPKAVSMIYFEPWGWIVSVTSYRREFDRLVQPDGFRAYVLGLTFGKGGYVYVVHDDGSIIIHPKLTGNPLRESGSAELQSLHTAAREKGEGETTYTWGNPGEGKAQRKTVYFKQLPRFHWIVVSSIPQSELYAPAYRAGLMVILAVVVCLFLSSLLTASLAASMTRPLEDLTRRLEAGEDGDFTVRMPVSSRDEVGRLSGHFNRFMDGLQAVRDRLAASIEERTRTEAARARLAATVAQIKEHVLITDTEHRIIYVNPAFERVTGYGAEEVLGRKPDFLGGVRREENLDSRIRAALAAGRSWRGRITNRRKDGTEFIQEGSISSIRDEAGAVVNYVAINRDVTREVELEAGQRQSQKLEAMGILAGGIAHDFNNILTAILGFAELAEQQTAAEDPLRDNLREIVRSGTRARELVSRILAFSRQTKRETRPVELGSLVKETLKLLRASIPSTIGIEQRISEDHGLVLADATEIHQVVMNLCTNAAQAIGDRPGTITVSVRRTHGASGEWMELSVSDDGAGMDEEIQVHMFEPFYTTKEAGKGTGLGLTMVHGIVSQMEGQIQVESSPGGGTSLRILLPVREGDGEPGEAPVDEVPRGRGERILLVDDEDAVRAVCARTLAALDYKVTAVSNAPDALRYVERDPDGFQLVLTDLTMPEMTGLDLARGLSRFAPRLPIVLMTGSIGRDMEETAREAGIARLLCKPFRRSEVASVVRAILDAAPG